MVMTYAEHIEDQLEKIDAELKAGPRLTRRVPRRPDGLPVDLNDIGVLVEEKRIRLEWPTRHAQLLERRRRLEAEREGLRKRDPASP